MVGLFMLVSVLFFLFSFFNTRNRCDEVNYVALMCLAATTSQDRQTRAQQHWVTLHACDVFLLVITLFVAPSVADETKERPFFPDFVSVLRRGSQDLTFHSSRSRPPHIAVTPQLLSDAFKGTKSPRPADTRRRNVRISLLPEPNQHNQAAASVVH